MINVHPAADLFPLLADAELVELGEDIRRHGMVQPITTWSETGDGRNIVLLDGRNRLDAMERVGLPVVGDDGQLAPFNLNEYDGDDPWGFVIAANIRRRHLPLEDKDRLIVQLLKADPNRSNRTIANLTDTSHPHVAKVRERAEKSGDVETVSTSLDAKGRRQPIKKKRGANTVVIHGGPCTRRRVIWSDNDKATVATVEQALNVVVALSDDDFAEFIKQLREKRPW